MLSESVADALKLQGYQSTSELEKFIRMFNKFFDILNVSDVFGGVKARNENLEPFRSANDVRLLVCLYLYCHIFVYYIIGIFRCFQGKSCDSSSVCTFVMWYQENLISDLNYFSQSYRRLKKSQQI